MGNAISKMVAGFRAAPAKPREAASPPSRPKIADRVGDNAGAGKTATAPAAAVAQKVVLFDEDPANAQGKRYVGSAIWRTETVSPGPGLAPELAIRADVEIPERHMRMTWSLRRNTDKALPASHTIEIQFTLPADFDQGGIGNVPGVLMKPGEQARGVPLAGLAVKVTNGYFLIGLSAVEIDKQRNIQMLKQRDWLDIPIVYTSGKRAILALEKGTPGQRAFRKRSGRGANKLMPSLPPRDPRLRSLRELRRVRVQPKRGARRRAGCGNVSVFKYRSIPLARVERNEERGLR